MQEVTALAEKLKKKSKRHYREYISEQKLLFVYYNRVKLFSAVKSGIYLVFEKRVIKHPSIIFGMYLQSKMNNNNNIDKAASNSQWGKCNIRYKNKISIKRNNSGWCELCHAKETCNKKRKRTDSGTDFSFEDGSRFAIVDPESTIKQEKQGPCATQMSGCQPLELPISKEDNNNSTSMTSYTLLKDSEFTRLAKFLEFESSTLSKEYVCSFR